MAKNTGSKWQWTNERHVNFLNSMEASFVHSMLIPPLDRYLPDTWDSTEDRPTRPSASESSGRRTEKKTRILARQKSSHDQVVPQFDDKDKEDRDHLDVSIGRAR